MADLSFKLKDIWKGNAFRKVAQGLAELQFEVKAGDGKRFLKGAEKMAGFGKSMAEKFEEFFETGKIAKAEELRSKI